MKEYTVPMPDGTCFRTMLASSDKEAIGAAWFVLLAEAQSLRRQPRFRPDTKFTVTTEEVWYA